MHVHSVPQIIEQDYLHLIYYVGFYTVNTQDQTLISIKCPKEMLNAGFRPYTPSTTGLNSFLTKSTLKFDPDQCPTRDRVIKCSHIG